MERASYTADTADAPALAIGHLDIVHRGEINAATGALLRELNLDPTRDYQPRSVIVRPPIRNDETGRSVRTTRFRSPGRSHEHTKGFEAVVGGDSGARAVVDQASQTCFASVRG